MYTAPVAPNSCITDADAETNAPFCWVEWELVRSQWYSHQQTLLRSPAQRPFISALSLEGWIHEKVIPLPVKRREIVLWFPTMQKHSEQLPLKVLCFATVLYWQNENRFFLPHNGISTFRFQLYSHWYSNTSAWNLLVCILLLYLPSQERREFANGWRLFF